MRTPVVVIETANGPVRIDSADFDPSIHTLVGYEDDDTFEIVAAPAAPAAPADAAPADAAPADAAGVSIGIAQEGGKWYLVNMAADNERVGDLEGYATKAKATSAAQSLMG